MSDANRFNHAVKLDANKPPMDLIPWESMEGVARVLDFGRIKYQAHNWRKGFKWTRLASAALRHIFAWLSGEDLDPESGLSHIDHATCCLMFLSAHVKGKAMGEDDRAFRLLEEKELPAAHVPRHTTKRYRWYVLDTDGVFQTSLILPASYVSREIAQKAWDDAPTLDKRYYDLREVDYEEILPK